MPSTGIAMNFRRVGATAAAVVFFAGVGLTLYEPKSLGPPVAFGDLVGGLFILRSHGQ